MNILWTEAELEILRRERLAGAKVPAIAALLGRPVAATYTRLRMLKIIAQPHATMTKDELEAIRQMIARPGSATDAQIAQALGRTIGSVRHNITKLGLANNRPVATRTPRKPRMPDPAVLAKREAERQAKTATKALRAQQRLEAQETRRAAAQARAQERAKMARIRALAKTKEAKLQKLQRVETRNTKRTAKADAKSLANAAMKAAKATERKAAAHKRLSNIAAQQNAVPRAKAYIQKAVENGTAQKRIASNDVAPAVDSMAFLATPVKTTTAMPMPEPQRTTSGRGGWVVKRTNRPSGPILPPIAETEKQDLIAQFIAEKGVSKIQENPATRALNRLRARGKIILRQGNGYLIDHRVTIANDDELIAYAQARLGL